MTMNAAPPPSPNCYSDGSNCGCDAISMGTCGLDVAGCIADCDPDTLFIGCLECLEAIEDCAVRLLRKCMFILLT